MIVNDVEIPDAPSDPEARRLWKLRWFTVLYGVSKTRLKDILEVEPTPQHTRPSKGYHK